MPHFFAMVKELKLLQEALEEGIIDIGTLSQSVEKVKNEKILSRHPYKIWEGKDGKWYTRVDEGGVKKLKKRGSRDELEEFLIFFYKNAEETANYTFSEEFERWIDKKRKWKELSDATILRYKTDYKRFFKGSEIDKLYTRFLSDDIVEDFVKGRIASFNLTSKSYQNLKIILIGVLKFSKRSGHTNYSIGTFFQDFDISDRSFKKQGERKAYIYLEDERKRLFEALEKEGSIKSKALMLQILTGMRIGEISSLQFQDNIEPGKLFIRRSEVKLLSEDGESQIRGVSDSAKMGHNGVILIPKKAQEILDSIPRGKSAYIFSDGGNRLSSRVLSYHLKKMCGKIGIDYRPTHAIRKTYASMLLSRNVDESIVKSQMRHNEIATTRQYYFYKTKDESKEREILEKVISL